MPTVLFIGRFQPFHNGHLSVIKSLQAKHFKVVIGIGSSQKSKTQKNPFTYEERKAMIQSLNDIPTFPIPDVPNDDEWVEHVKKIVPKFDEVHTGNDLVSRLFKEKGYLVHPVDIKLQITGTMIRQLMKENKDISEFVPKECLKLIYHR